ncbi:MAG: GNAT family N-acetyltransferase [Spirochaetales bacterium]|nr:GNAT family N-acetyltransferase [Spirochaetales bacterium]
MNIRIFQSTTLTDTVWDEFLETTDRGQLEQSNKWAAYMLYKKGWKILRQVFVTGNKITAGFQILYKTIPVLGNFGYLLKGPVIADEETGTVDAVLIRLKETVKRNNIGFLLAQPPDRDSRLTGFLRKSGFIKNRIKYMLKKATVIIDLDQDEEQILGRMKRQKRQNIMKGLKNGLTLREGTRDDLPVFYRFMEQTCKAQQVTPNPPSVDHVFSLWDIFHKSGNIKVFFITYNNEDISAMVVLPFGSTVNCWKFGWSGKCNNLRPNDVIYWEIIKWSKRNGYRYIDFMIIQLDKISASNKEGTTSSESHKNWSHFKLGFGVEILYLQDGSVYIYNRIYRFIFNIVSILFHSIMNKIIYRIAN